MNVFLWLLFVSTLKYPVAPTTNQVDDYHGTQVKDPYRGLEKADDPATERWVEAENQLTHSYLDAVPGRAALKERLTKLWDYEKYDSFWKAGDHYFYLRNSGLQNQSVLYTASSIDGESRVLLDPNTYRKDGTAAINGRIVSPKGTLLAYGVAQAGSDWTEWRVREVSTGKDRTDFIQWTKSGNVTWKEDESGFYYSRFPEPAADQLLTVAALNHKVYYHKLGDPQSADTLVYERPEHPTWTMDADIADGGRYLFFGIYTGVPGQNLLSYQDLQSRKPHTIDLITTEQYEYQPLASSGTTVFIKTNDGAPRFRIVAIDLDHPERAHWKEVVAQRAETLEEAAISDDRIRLSYLKDAHSVTRLASLDGKDLGEVAMPSLGSAAWAPSHIHDKELFYTFQTFTSPSACYRLDLASGRSEVIRKSKVAFDPEQYETKQVFYPSKDGTKVPMFLSYRKGLPLNGQNPTLLYAYGGFNIAITPAFRPWMVEWMNEGGIYASACLRGGSEYGETWHQAGMRDKKQNVFDDFITAGEWLIANRYTSPPKLAIYGGSNGGLLVGAVLNQRPDLFGAAMPSVGVMDMFRFHKFGFGTQWVGEYGSPDNAADFKVIARYSPLHNIQPGAQYPATLITTADHDDRVMPGHSLKYAATLQQAQAGKAPILIRIETRAGHGAGKPTSKQIDEIADRLAFLQSALGMH